MRDCHTFVCPGGLVAPLVHILYLYRSSASCGLAYVQVPFVALHPALSVVVLQSRSLPARSQRSSAPASTDRAYKVVCGGLLRARQSSAAGAWLDPALHLSIGQNRHNHSWGLFREALTLLRASALRQWADYSNDVEADDFGSYRRDYEGGR